jgi:hypothetical protein
MTRLFGWNRRGDRLRSNDEANPCAISFSAVPSVREQYRMP